MHKALQVSRSAGMTLAVLLKHVKLGTVKTPRDYARYALMILSVAAFCYACLQVNQLVTNSKLFEGNASIKAVAYIEPVKVAITQKLEGAKGLFQSSLLFMAVLWGLVIARREERVLGLRQGSWPELVMFIIANALFAASAYCYVEYTDAISRVHALGDIQYDEPKDLTIMDYRDPRIN